MKILRLLGAVFAIFILIISCKNEPHFTLTGKIHDAAGEYLYLEKREFSHTVLLDSVKIKDDGSFSFTSPAPSYPDLYILKLDSQYINISVDSIEVIKIETSKKNFSTGYTVEGSPATEMMKEVLFLHFNLTNEIKILRSEYNGGKLSEEDYLEKLQQDILNYKDTVKRLIIKDPKSPSAYFALFQKINGYLIFDPYQKNDSKIYSAVATSWNYYYKNTPRAKYLYDFAINSIKEIRDKEKKAAIVEGAAQTPNNDYYNIELPDIHNNRVSLNSFRGKIVLLDFTAYQTRFSSAHNMELNTVYRKYKNNMEIYQVSLDSDLHFWQNAASNLPWICVRDENSVTSELIYRFNFQELPTMFLLDRNGMIVKRLSTGDNIENEVAKML